MDAMQGEWSELGKGLEILCRFCADELKTYLNPVGRRDCKKIFYSPSFNDC